MRRLNLVFDQIAASAELRVKAIWPRITNDDFIVPHVKGLWIQSYIDEAHGGLDADGERVASSIEIGDEMSADDEVRPTIFRWDCLWALSEITAAGILLLEPQSSGYIPCDLVVPIVLIETDSISLAGHSSLTVKTLVTIDYNMVSMNEIQWMEMLLSRGMDLKDFHELGRRVSIESTRVARNSGTD